MQVQGYYICLVNLNIDSMIELEITLSGEKIGWIGTVNENLHYQETLRVHFSGFVTSDGSDNVVMVQLPEKLKFRSNSKIRKKEYEERRFICTLPDLPYWREIHKDEDELFFDFNAEVVEITYNGIIVCLPESLVAEDNDSEGVVSNEELTFTFNTKHTYLLDMLSRVLSNRPIVHFHGPLSDLNKRDNKVSISLPVNFSFQTEGGGMASLSPQDIELAVVDDLPLWREHAKRNGSPGFIFVLFDAVVVGVDNNEITVALPDSYR